MAFTRRSLKALECRPTSSSTWSVEHEAQSFFYSRSFNGHARSDHVVVVEITMHRGRSDAMKRALYAAIARNLQERAQVARAGRPALACLAWDRAARSSDLYDLLVPGEGNVEQNACRVIDSGASGRLSLGAQQAGLACQ